MKEGVEMLNKKYIFIIVLILSNILNAVKLSEVEGIKRLSNRKNRDRKTGNKKEQEIKKIKG